MGGRLRCHTTLQTVGTAIIARSVGELVVAGFNGSTIASYGGHGDLLQGEYQRGESGGFALTHDYRERLNLSPNQMESTLEFAEDLARRAGALIAAERENQTLDLSYKGGTELLTSADLKADELIRGEIEKTYPEHNILSEESSPDFSDPAAMRRPLWIVDPIDGTVNYAYGMHQTAVSIAYAEGGLVQAGVVCCPFYDETFTARRGGGALLNGRPIRVSECGELARALIGTGFPYDAEARVALVERLRLVLGHCRDIRRVGSAASDLCWVAMGRLDAFCEALQPWDLAAAALIAREAGARVGHLGPVEGGMPEELYGVDLVVAAPGIYEDLVELLRPTASTPSGP